MHFMEEEGLRRGIIKGFAIFCIIALAVLLYKVGNELCLIRGHGNVTTESCVFTQSAERLYNPNRGFYYMHGFWIDDSEADFRQNVADRFCRDEETKLTMIQINLQYYRDKEISEQGLRNIEALFEALEQVDKQLIVRFLYDWDGENEYSEPESLDVILKHISQVGPVLRKYKDRIFVMQGIFIGNWGEMNGTRYANQRDMQALAKQLAQVTDSSTFLSVRMPMQWRMITQQKDPAQVVTGDGSLAARLGLYNDGMLGSWSDYGTYGEHTKEEHGYFTYWNREEELAFQEELCQKVPIGGEVIVDNPYNDFENALQDMKRMHVTYINEDFDRNVLDKWAAVTVSEEGCFNGMDGLSYIERHLGYRLLIKEAVLDYRFREDKLQADITLQNVGFAPIYHEAQVWIALEDKEKGEVHYYRACADLRELTGGNDSELLSTVHVEIPLTGRTAGEYEVYFDIQDIASEERISLANEQKPEEYGYRIGTVRLEPIETYIEGWKQQVKGR